MNNETLDEIIERKFKKFTTEQIVKRMESTRKNLDDETHELHRRLKLENKQYKWDDKDEKIIIY